MHPFTVLFLVALTLGILLQLWLGTRHVRYVRAHRQRVPDFFTSDIPLDAHQKAADYAVARTQVSQTEDIWGAVLLLAWTLGGGLDVLDRWSRAMMDSDWFAGTTFLLFIMLIAVVLDLPFAIYRTFFLEQQFGFNRTTPKLFVIDLFKRTLLTVAFGAPLILIALWLMASTGPRWWIWVWAVWIGFSLLMTWTYPTFIAPWFNKFKPLDREILRERLQNLMTRAGFHSEGIYVIDSSQRTAHGNAYFTGFGRSKRVVFFDNLLTQLEDAEVEAVVAHELGHFKLRHIIKRLALVAALSLLALALLGWLATQTWFYSALGVTQPSNHTALALFIMVSPVFAIFVTPLFARGSRKHEYEADAFAAQQSEASALISALVKLHRENASTLTPDPLHSAFYDSHPPALARIQRLAGKA